MSSSNFPCGESFPSVTKQQLVMIGDRKLQRLELEYESTQNVETSAQAEPVGDVDDEWSSVDEEENEKLLAPPITDAKPREILISSGTA